VTSEAVVVVAAVAAAVVVGDVADVVEENFVLGVAYSGTRFVPEAFDLGPVPTWMQCVVRVDWGQSRSFEGVPYQVVRMGSGWEWP